MKVGLNIFLSTLFAAFLLCVPAVCMGQEQYLIKTIVIDPGHGGKDPGAVWGNIYEKDINLAVALEVGKLIRAQMPDVKMVFTREKDVFIPLKDRGEMANKADADLFLSIHVNATSKNPGPSGALTLVMGTDRADDNLDIAARENKVIMYEEDYTTTYSEYMSGSTEMFIIYSLMQYVNIEHSLVFADILQKHYKKSTPMPDMGIRRQNPLVLWYTTMPGILTELGFINNPEDRKYLASAAGQKKMALTVFEAFKEYKQVMESRNKPLQVEDGNGDISATLVVADPAPRTGSDRNNAAVSSAKEPKGVVYRVQILSASRRIAPNSAELKEYRGKAYERTDGGRYRYYVGECKTHKEALELQAKVRKSFPDAFTIAFKDGVQITVPEARKLTD